MSIFDDIKAKADANGDGKLTKDDLETLRDKLPADKLDSLKAKADANGDGKLDLADLAGLKEAGSNLGNTAGGFLGKLKGMFKK